MSQSGIAASSDSLAPIGLGRLRRLTTDHQQHPSTPQDLDRQESNSWNHSIEAHLSFRWTKRLLAFQHSNAEANTDNLVRVLDRTYDSACYCPSKVVSSPFSARHFIFRNVRPSIVTVPSCSPEAAEYPGVLDSEQPPCRRPWRPLRSPDRLAFRCQAWPEVREGGLGKYLVFRFRWKSARGWCCIRFQARYFVCSPISPYWPHRAREIQEYLHLSSCFLNGNWLCEQDTDMGTGRGTKEAGSWGHLRGSRKGSEELR